MHVPSSVVFETPGNDQDTRACSVTIGEVRSEGSEHFTHVIIAVEVSCQTPYFTLL